MRPLAPLRRLSRTLAHALHPLLAISHHVPLPGDNVISFLFFVLMPAAVTVRHNIYFSVFFLTADNNTSVMSLDASFPDAQAH